jgi:tetratricopeptide (TPR) repeat protein
VTHLSEGELNRFVHGGLEPAECRRVVRHLAGGCQPCRKRLMPFMDVLFQPNGLDELAGGAVVDFYDSALDAAATRARRYESRWRKESKQLEKALEAARGQVMERPMEELFVCEEILALRGRTLVEALLRLSFEERYRNPHRMLFLAYIASSTAGLLKPEEHGGPALAADFQALTWAELANAYRVNDQHDRAEGALAEAASLLDRGTRDLLLLARVLDIQASLRSDQRRLGEALTLLEIAHNLYRDAGDRHLAGRVLIKQGIASRYNGQPREAVCLLREGLELLDCEKDPQLTAVGQQSLIDALADCREFREARQLLLSSGLRQAFAADPLNLLKLRWVEGKILAGRGRLGRAERVLEEVREELHDRGREYDAALVGLELAAVWLQQGKMAEVREVVEETVEALRELGVVQEGFKAALSLRLACEQRQATVGLFRYVHDFLTRLQWQPQLRYAP